MTTYYVDPANGSNANSGTSEGDALASISAFDEDASISLASGDQVVLIANGTDTPAGNIAYSFLSDVTLSVATGNSEDYVVDGANLSSGATLLYQFQCENVDWLGSESSNIVFRNVPNDAWKQESASGQTAGGGIHRWVRFEDYGNDSTNDGGNGCWLARGVNGTQWYDCTAFDGSEPGDSDGWYVGGPAGNRPGGHLFERCTAHRNADDGFDLFRADRDNPCEFIDCVAFENGRDDEAWQSGDETGSVGAWGDGNGFKLAGDDGGNNTLYRCLSYRNRGRAQAGAGSAVGRGFDDNGWDGNLVMQCTSWANESVGYRASGSGTRYVNNVSYEDPDAVSGGTSENNTWNLSGITVSDSDFVSLQVGDPDVLIPAAGSDLIDAGVVLDGYSVGGTTIDFSALTATETFDGSSPELGYAETTSSTLATAPEPSLSYSRVLNAVDDLGMDNTGATDISGTLQTELEQGSTKIEFPPGQYLWSNVVDTVLVDGTGIVGLGDTREDVEFVFPSGFGEDCWETRYADGVELRNVTIQQTMDDTTGVGMLLRADDNLLIRDVHWDGYTPGQTEGAGRQVTARIETTDGYGLVDNYYTDDGGPVGSYPDRSGGIFMGSAHEGELRLINSDIRNLGSSAMYFTQHSGCARVENVYLENNDNVNLRIDGGDHPTKDSWARDIEIKLDWTAFSGKSLPGDDFGGDYNGFENMRGILAESGGGAGNTGLTLENISIDAPNVAKGTDAIVEVRDNHGAVDMTDVEIRVDHDWPSKNIVWLEATDTAVQTPYDCSLDGVTIVGAADTSEAIRIEANRDGSSVTGSCLEMTGTCDGVGVYSAANVSVTDSNINVGGTPVVGATTSGITTSGTCSFDGTTSGDSGTGDTTGAGWVRVTVDGIVQTTDGIIDTTES